jgi:hypothetical protein
VGRLTWAASAFGVRHAGGLEGPSSPALNNGIAERDARIPDSGIGSSTGERPEGG